MQTDLGCDCMQLEVLADASFVVVILSVVWVIVHASHNGLRALDKVCQLPVGCTPDDNSDYGIGDCESCFGTFPISGFTSMGALAGLQQCIIEFLIIAFHAHVEALECCLLSKNKLLLTALGM